MSISGLTNPNPRFLSSLSSPKFSPNFTPNSNSNSNSEAKFKIRVSASGAQSNSAIHAQFSAPSSATASKKDDQDKRDYYLNLGYAIRSLREEFPELFYREPRFDIYREDIVFKDPLNTFTGIENYKSLFWALRFHGRIFFKALWVDILSVWQPMENVILIRWTVHGVPRVPWESRGRFDGISEYKLDKNGKIYEHKVDNIALNSLGKFKVVSVEELILSLGRPSTPKPTCFELSSSSSSSSSSSMESLTSTELMNSVSHYLDSALDLSTRHELETAQKT
ncbi:hypothetical protein vseg_004422 [Gypsophila vaccaria]